MILKNAGRLAKNIVGLLLLSLFFVFYDTALTASPPAVITYQGKLLVSGSSATTTYQMGFLIYDAVTDGNLLYTAAGTLPSTSTIAVTPAQGIFNIDLGGTGTNALTTSTFASNSNLYLEIWIGGQRLSPRRQLTSAPFALNSQFLMGLPSAVTATSAYIPQSDSNGNFSFAGTAQSAGVSGGILYVNPLSATADYSLFGVALGGAERFRLDAEGDVWVSGSLSVTGTLSTQGTATVPDLVVNNSITLGGEARTSWPTGSGGSSGPWVTSTGRTYLSPTSTVVLVGTSTTSTTGTIMEVSGDTLFANGTSTYRGLAWLDGIVRTPRYVTSTPVTGIVNSSARIIAVQGSYAYIGASSAQTLSVIDLSDPSRPSQVGQVSLPGDVTSVSVQGDYAYVTMSLTIGVQVINISEPSAPVLSYLIGTADVPGGMGFPVAATAVGNYLYIADDTAFIVMDISDPAYPRHLRTETVSSWAVENIVANGKLLYIAAGSTLRIFDISVPAHPRQVGSLNAPSAGNVEDVAVQGRYAYIVSSGSNRLSVVDVSSSTAPVIVGTLVTGSASTAPYLTAPNSITVSGRYAYVAAQTSQALEIVDISSSTAPIHTGSIRQLSVNGQTFIPFSLSLQGNYLYSASSHGFSVVDVSGARITNADIGSTKIGNLQVMNEALFNNTVSVRGGLNVGAVGLVVGGDFAMLAGTSTNNTVVSNTLRFSHTALFETAATGTDDVAFVFQTKNRWTTSTSKYLISVRNNGVKLFSVATNGETRIHGNLFASSTTIGTPGSPGDLAERVDILETETVEAGDVVVVSRNAIDTYEVSKVAYATDVAGVISTNPTIVAGYGRTDHVAPLALAGRVPVKISLENGPITAGDMLVTASAPGRAMRFDSSNTSGTPAIVGIALEDIDEDTTTTDRILVLLRSGWVSPTTQSAAPTQLTVMQQSDGNISSVITGDMDLGGYALLGAARIEGANGRWEINNDGLLIQHVETVAGPLDLYTVQSNDSSIMLSGSSQLVGGTATILLDSRVSGLIGDGSSIQVMVSLTSPGDGLYVSSKSATEFVVQETRGGTSNATFDWVVIADRQESVQDSQAVSEVVDSSANTIIEVPEENAPIESELSVGNELFEEPVQIDNTDTSTTDEIIVEEPSGESLLEALPSDETVVQPDEDTVGEVIAE